MKSLIFDLDETLVDRAETMRLFLINQHSRLNSHINSTCDEFVKSVLHHQKNGYENKHTAYQLSCVELEGNDNFADELFKDFKDLYGFEAVLFEGVTETLEKLSKEYSLAIVTNGRSRCQNAKIDYLGIRHLFNVIKISEEHGTKKPGLSIFESCLKKLDTQAHSCVCIGDNPNNDLTPAKELGMKTIWVRNSHFQAPKNVDAIIDSVAAIQPILAKL